MSYEKQDDYSGCSGTCLQGTFIAPPARLVEVFGPHLGPGDKTTGEYVFKDAQGNRYTIYDWKSPWLDWNSHCEYEFHVGGCNMKLAQRFIAWVKGRLGLTVEA